MLISIFNTLHLIRILNELHASLHIEQMWDCFREKGPNANIIQFRNRNVTLALKCMANLEPSNSMTNTPIFAA